MHTRDQLTKEQNDIIAFVKEKKKCGIFVTMGGGKTVVSLTVISDLLEAGEVKKALVLCPPRLVRGWKSEAQKWDHLSELNLIACEGSAQKKRELINTESDIHILGYESMLAYFKSTPHPFPWDMVIFDESTKIKSHSSMRFKTMKRITRGGNLLKYCMLLTGTPMANGFMDLWAQMYFVDGGKRLGKNISQYRDLYFQQAHHCDHVFNVRPNAGDVIKRLIKDVCYCVTTPSKSLDDIKITFTDKVFTLPKIAMHYSKQIKNGVLTINSIEIPAETPVKKLTKLLQIESGFVYDDNPVKKTPYHIHDAPIEALREAINERPDKHFMIAYNFTADVCKIKEALPEAVQYAKTEDLDNWNARKIKYFLVHPQSASHGINAQFGGSVLIWYGLTWSLENYLQMNARLHRQGQTEDVEIVRIIAEGGINYRIASVIGIKDKTQRDVMDYLENKLLH